MNDSLLASSLENLDILLDVGNQYSIESSAEAYVNFEASRFSIYLDAVANRFRSIPAVNYIYDPLPAAALPQNGTETRTFSNLKDIEIQIPAGLAIHMKPYLTNYLEIVKRLISLPETLGQFFNILGTVMADPTLMAAQAGLLKLERAVTLFSHKDLDSFRKYFNQSGRTSAKYSQVFDRVSDYHQAHALADEIGRATAMVDLDTVYKQLERFKPVIDSIRSQMSDKDVSGPNVSRLIEVTNRLAVTTEFVGLMKHMTAEIVEAMRTNVAILSKPA